jgi:hypothetical protein
MLPNCYHKAVQDVGEYYPAAALNKYHVLQQQPHKDQPHQPTKTNSTDIQYINLSIMIKKTHNDACNHDIVFLSDKIIA